MGATTTPASPHQRWGELGELARWPDGPMTALSVAWLALLVLKLTGDTNGLLQWLGTAIWAVFILDFALRLAIAPNGLAYVARNWLTLLSLSWRPLCGCSAYSESFACCVC